MPYLLLLLIIHGEGMPRAEDYNGVRDCYQEFWIYDLMMMETLDIPLYRQHGPRFYMTLVDAI